MSEVEPNGDVPRKRSIPSSRGIGNNYETLSLAIQSENKFRSGALCAP